MHPILYDFGFYQLRTYGLMLALGFLAALFFCRHESKRAGIPPAVVTDLFIWVLGGGILGARLLYVVIHHEEFGGNPLAVFAVWNGGLIYYGGFLGGLLGGFLFARRHKIRFLEISDLCMPTAMLGQSIGRWGCFMAGCCYGKEVDPSFPLGVCFPHDTHSLIPPQFQNADMANPAHFLHPTQLYNSTNAILLWLILWVVLRKRKYRGQVTGIFLVLYAVTRSWLETFRGDFQERAYFGPLSTSQWISVALLALGIYLLITCRKHPVAPPAAEKRES